MTQAAPSVAPSDPPRLHQTYAQSLPELSVPSAADAAPSPAPVVVNASLARELGIDPAWLQTEEGLALLTGRLDADGRPAPRATAPDRPFTTAQAYAGYQFGHPSPQLGDGRAVLLGDLVAPDGTRHDLHLKGSGRTPFARGGDGKAPLGPMLREHLIGEAMHALGIPTTRALAVVDTGERVFRRGPVPERAAILARRAASHLRVGTFQYAAWHLGPDVLRRLTDHAIERHWPAAADAPHPPLALLRAVTHAQAELVARWMLVGFVHGVMNTDNMTISGETIDYGPCAFLDSYRPDAVFSSIDAQGRYAYRNQPGIALWNLSRFAEALLPILDPDPDAAVTAATGVLEEFEDAHLRAWTRGMAAKLGIALPEEADDAALAEVRSLAEDALALLEAHSVDLTGFFRALGDGTARDLLPAESLGSFDAWSHRLDRLRGSGPAADAARTAMARVNPLYIPRNHHVEAALRAAELGDMGPYQRLIAAVSDPFTRRDGLEDLEGPGPEGSSPFVTFCGT